MEIRRESTSRIMYGQIPIKNDFEKENATKTLSKHKVENL